MHSSGYYPRKRRYHSPYGKKRIYGSAYQKGLTTKYQRYGRTVPLDPGYVSIPKSLPTRQSQMLQVEELRKAGLIPEGPAPQVYNYNVEGEYVLPEDQYMAQGSTFTAVCPVYKPYMVSRNIHIPQGNTLSIPELIVSQSQSAVDFLENIKRVQLICYCSSTFGTIPSGSENAVAIEYLNEDGYTKMMYFRAQQNQSFNCIFRVQWDVKYFPEENTIKWQEIYIEAVVDKGSSGYWQVNGENASTANYITAYANSIAATPATFVSINKNNIVMFDSANSISPYHSWADNFVVKILTGQKTTGTPLSSWTPSKEVDINRQYIDTGAGDTWSSVKFTLSLQTYTYSNQM